jgi:hypothetical protein
METPLVEKILEIDKLMDHLLSGSACSDEDALLVSREDQSMYLDTSIWDLGAYDSSRMSGQDDIVAHIGYSVIQREITPSDGVQWHTGGPSSTVGSGKFNTLSYVESVFRDSRVDNSSHGYEVEPQHVYDQKSHHLVE